VIAAVVSQLARQGSKLVDFGAGPGLATAQLAEIVGKQGEVVSVERSARFLAALKHRLSRHGLKNVCDFERDLMSGPIPAIGSGSSNRDFRTRWCLALC
jgi:16S rRNA C967 or C1407 C5-methylase (RsmB/RsmF family)